MTETFVESSHPKFPALSGLEFVAEIFEGVVGQRQIHASGQGRVYIYLGRMHK